LIALRVEQKHAAVQSTGEGERTGLEGVGIDFDADHTREGLEVARGGEPLDAGSVGAEEPAVGGRLGGGDPVVAQVGVGGRKALADALGFQQTEATESTGEQLFVPGGEGVDVVVDEPLEGIDASDSGVGPEVETGGGRDRPTLAVGDKIGDVVGKQAVLLAEDLAKSAAERVDGEAVGGGDVDGVLCGIFDETVNAEDQVVLDGKQPTAVRRKDVETTIEVADPEASTRVFEQGGNVAIVQVRLAGESRGIGFERAGAAWSDDVEFVVDEGEVADLAGVVAPGCGTDGVPASQVDLRDALVERADKETILIERDGGGDDALGEGAFDAGSRDAGDAGSGPNVDAITLDGEREHASVGQGLLNGVALDRSSLEGDDALVEGADPEASRFSGEGGDGQVGEIGMERGPAGSVPGEDAGTLSSEQNAAVVERQERGEIAVGRLGGKQLHPGVVGFKKRDALPRRDGDEGRAVAVGSEPDGEVGYRCARKFETDVPTPREDAATIVALDAALARQVDGSGEFESGVDVEDGRDGGRPRRRRLDRSANYVNAAGALGGVAPGFEGVGGAEPYIDGPDDWNDDYGN